MNIFRFFFKYRFVLSLKHGYKNKILILKNAQNCVKNLEHERFHDEEHGNLLNTMWLTAITFLCVGYGDIVPNTYCGRGITLTCGIVVSLTD